MTAALPLAAPGGLIARVLRSSAITVVGFVLQQAMRLAANLILARLLFPEAFGLMAIVSVFLVGLQMFSDVGLGPAIMGSRRGDDPEFLNTAWTIQILRGVLLWLAASALAFPVAAFYGEPQLTWFLPVAALTLLIAGFNPTRLETANRHLQAGRVTLVELASQALSLVVAVALAWATGSVWSLVISGIVASVTTLILLNLWLPGAPNRLRWEGAAASELIHFGKWIFLSTLCAFAVMQADKVILGHALSLGEFGLYNIAWYLASFPFMLGGLVMRRVLIPVFRDSPPAGNPANFARIRRLRLGASAVLLALAGMLAFGGVALVGLMYDARYQGAGAMVVMIAALQVPALIILTCDHAALAAGDSRRYFWLTAARAILVTLGTLGGLSVAGLPGALIGQALGNLAAWPVLAWLLRPHGALDPLHDGVVLAAGAGLGAAAIWWNQTAIAALWSG